MSDLKKIGKVGRKLLRSLADRLGIEGVDQRAPIVLDTSRLVPVVLAGGLYACNEPELNAFMDLTNQSMDARSQYGYGLWGPEASWLAASYNEVASPQKLLSYENKEHWVRAMRVVLTYAAAGAVADNQKRMLIQVEVRNFTGTPNDIAYVIEHRFVVRTGQTFYSWVFPQGNMSPLVAFNMTEQSLPYGRWDGYVPPGYFAGVRILRDDGGVWPADTTLHGEVWISEAPEGVITNGH